MWKRRITVQKFNQYKKQKGNESLITESSLTIQTPNHNQQLSIIPDDITDLVTGYVIAKKLVPSIEHIGHISIKEQIATVEIITKEINKTTTPQTLESITLQDLYHLTAQFAQQSSLYKDTSITQSAAFADSLLNLNYLSQDLTEEQACYKSCGKKLLNNDVSSSILLISGKISKDIILLANQFSVQLIISRLSITQAAFDLATQSKISIIGFARGTKLSIFSDTNNYIQY